MTSKSTASSHLWVIRGSLAIIGVCLILMFVILMPFSVGAEDAVMLHQYSRNLVETGTVGYIPGGERAEGATDFLWMIYIAACMKLHILPMMASAIASILAAFALTWVLLKLGGRRFTISSSLAIIGILGLFPQMQAVIKGFSVLPFGLFIASTILWCLKGNDSFAAMSALVLCLLRPDGVVFALPAIVLLRLYRNPQWLGSIATFVGLFVMPGLAYFLWRWRYFSHFMPLPFSVKSDTPRILGLFVEASVASLVPYCVVSAAILVGIYGRELFSWKTMRLVLVILVLPTGFYSYLRLDQNLNDRFFFYYPLGILIICALCWDQEWQVEKRYVLGGAFALWVLFFLPSTTRAALGNVLTQPDWRRLADIGQSLDSPDLHGSLLSTEAGIIPYFSRWKPYDPWGLNSPEYATHLIRPEEIVSLHPDLIILHGIGVGCTPSKVKTKTSREWENLIANLLTGVAEMPGYKAYQVPYWGPAKEARIQKFDHGSADYLCWYVSPSYAHQAAIVATVVRFGGKRLEE